MRPADISLYKTLHRRLSIYDRSHGLLGIHDMNDKDCFVLQLIDSVRRVRYVSVIRDKIMSGQCADARSIAFDPLKAASFHKRAGNIDEAFWLIFLATHFGKNGRTKWRLVKEVYGGNGHADKWNWLEVSRNPIGFQQWLGNNQVAIKSMGNFGNHRKYQSLDAYKPAGTGVAIRSYVDWVLANGSHQNVIFSAQATVGTDPGELFNHLYHSMNIVMSFGRMAKFDYLTMVGKMGLAPIEPNSAYMGGATGPLSGARLLFAGDSNSTLLSANEADSEIVKLNSHLSLYYGFQVLEDALCNWQKSPSKYIYFGG